MIEITHHVRSNLGLASSLETRQFCLFKERVELPALKVDFLQNFDEGV